MAPKRDYSKEQMSRAIEEVNRGEKVSVAATKYGVPRITLRNKVKGISPLDCNLGPSTVCPSPFKRAIYWPEPEIKKRRTKERLPSAITSDPYIEYIEKKEKEKKQKIEEKEKRAKERKEKQLLREKLKQEKKDNKKGKKVKTKAAKLKRKHTSSSSSDEINTDVEYQDSEYDVEEDLSKSESEDDNIPLKTLGLSQKREKKSKYVIIKYEGEYFPGMIKKVEGNQYEISTMVLSKGNTFRWPDPIDQICYDKNSIQEYIKEPVPINKRGFYKVEEMNKYLPFAL